MYRNSNNTASKDQSYRYRTENLCKEKTENLLQKCLLYAVAFAKIFHLTNVYFVNESEEIVIKDVEKKVAVYVEAIKLKGK